MRRTWRSYLGGLLGAIGFWLFFWVSSSAVLHYFYPSEFVDTELVKVNESQQSMAPSHIAIVEKKANLKEYLAHASTSRGQALFAQCAVCHILRPSSSASVASLGPNLWGVVGRPRASIAGFRYSRALRQQASQKWDLESLDAFIKSPTAIVKGTLMNYKGLEDPQDRADLLLYLSEATQHENDSAPR